jgi:excisionase family DNA binding protein
MSELLTIEELAEELKVDRETLRRWRVDGTGPAFIQKGERYVRYERKAVDEWKAANTATAK